MFNSCPPGVHISTSPIDRLCRTLLQYFMDFVALKYYTNIDIYDFRNFGNIPNTTKRVVQMFKNSNDVILQFLTEQQIAFIMNYYNNRKQKKIYKLVVKKISPNEVTLKDEEEIVKQCMRNNENIVFSDNWNHYQVNDSVEVFNNKPYLGKQYSNTLGENWIIEQIRGNNFYRRNEDDIKNIIVNNTTDTIWVSRHLMKPSDKNGNDVL